MAGLFLVALVAAVGWKLYQLAKAPQDRALRSVALCLACASMSYPFAMPGGATGFDTVAGHGAAKLAQNVLLLATVYFLMCFYLYAAVDEGGRSRRARVEGLVVVAVAVAITVAVTTVPHQALAGSFSTTDMTVPQVAFFYAGTGLYLMYALTAAALWTRRYARASPKPHSTGLWAAGAGMAGMAAACAIRAVIVGVRWRGGAVSGLVLGAVAVLLVVSTLLFVFGVTYPGLRMRFSLCRLWLRHRHEHARLEPLWTLMAQAAPHIVLSPDSSSSSLRERWRACGVHRRRHRRIVECRDGLVEISPYLPTAGDGETGALVDDAEIVAGRLRGAVRAHRDASAQPESARSLAALARQRSREDDIQELLALSDALRSTS